MATILIVDDNAGDIDLFRTAMCEADPTVQVHAVPSGAQALAFLAKENVFVAMPSPDLVLLDINMPGIDGFQTLRVIRETFTWPSLRVVVWSSSRREADERAAMSLGADEYAVKPATWDETLAAAIRLCQRLPKSPDRDQEE